MNWDSQTGLELILDLVGLLLCGCAIFLMFWWRRSEKRRIGAARRSQDAPADIDSSVQGRGQKANGHAGLQRSRREVTAAFQSAAFMKQFTDSSAHQQAAGGGSAAGPDSVAAHRSKPKPKDPAPSVPNVRRGETASRPAEEPAEEKDPYELARELIDRGFSVAQIAQQVSIPRGEIELMVKLKSNAYERPQFPDSDATAAD